MLYSIQPNIQFNGKWEYLPGLPRLLILKTLENMKKWPAGVIRPGYILELLSELIMDEGEASFSIVQPHLFHFQGRNTLELQTESVNRLQIHLF